MTFTLPRNFAALQALVTKRASVDSFNCATGLRKMTKFSAPYIDAKTKIGGLQYALPHYFTALLADCCFVARNRPLQDKPTGSATLFLPFFDIQQ